MDLKKPYQRLEEKKEVKLWDLATGFAKMSLCSFGGGLTAWAEQIAVKERKWLTDDEFLHALAITQVLPGPNMIKLAAYIGSNFRGVAGVFAAVCGLVAAPLVIVMIVGILFIEMGSDPAVHRTLNGLGACAAGMAFSLAIKLTSKNIKDWLFMIFGAVAFALIAFVRLPMMLAILIVGPLAIIAYWYYGKRHKKSEAEEEKEE